MTSSQSAYLNIISVTPPYSILWSNGDTSQFSENIPIGSSNVTLIDNRNCIFYDTFTIDCPETITSTFLKPHVDHIIGMVKLILKVGYTNIQNKMITIIQ